MRILVTEGAAAVTATRSLGRRGYEVLVGRSLHDVPVAGLSRYCAGILRLPSPIASPDAYAEAVLRAVRHHGCDAVLPVTDQSLLAMAPVRDEIESVSAYCAAPAAALERAWDKWELLDAGRRCGLAAPVSALVDASTDWNDAIRSVGIPCVLRGRRSYTRTGATLRTTRTGVHFRRADADRDARTRQERAEEFVASSFCNGRGRGVYLFVADGKVSVWFGHERVRETDPRGGPACAARSLSPSPELVERCTALLTGWGFTGAAMIEFRRDPATGIDWLVEVNPRLWGSIALAFHAGVDFPSHQVEYFLHGRIPRMPAGTLPSIGARQLSAELVHLAHAWKGPPADWENDYPAFPRALSEFFDSFAQGMRYYHQSVDDPLPGLMEPIALVVAGLRRLAP